MTALAPVLSATDSPEPSVEVDPPDLQGDPSQLVWWQDLVTGPLLRIAAIVVGAFVLRLVLLRLIDRFVARLSEPKPEPGLLTRTTQNAREVIGADVVAAERRSTRATSLGQLAKNLTSVIILVVAVIMVLAELGFNLAPLIAGAGVIGVALGFGAQSVVADFLSGVFMLLEDQYGVGDVVDLGEAAGVVEDVHLRVTRLRAVDGTVWYVRNGEIIRIGNRSQGNGAAWVDMPVSYREDIQQVLEIVREVCETFASDADWEPLLIEPPTVLGVDAITGQTVTVKVLAKTLAGENFGVQRELRARIKAAFDAHGIQGPPLTPVQGGMP